MKVHKNKRFTELSLITTVDFGKDFNYGFIRTIRDEEVKPFKFSNNAEGFSEFWEKVLEFKSTYGLKEIYFGFEPTGSYGHPLIQFMKDKGCHLMQINPKHTKRVKELEDNSPNKTDKKDPRVIANILLLGKAMGIVTPEGHKADLRYLIHTREGIMDERNRLLNQLEGLLAAYFPEFLQIMPALTSKSSLYVLKQYTLPEKVAHSHQGDFVDALRKVSRYRLSVERIKKLYKNACQTIGISQGSSGIQTSVKLLVKRLEGLIEDLRILETEIKEKVEDLPESRILLTIKGIQHLTVGYFLGELGDLDQYADKPALLKMVGLNLFEVSSGLHKGKKRITKRGRSLVRKTLYLAVLNMLKKDGIFHQEYQRRCQAGKAKMSSIVVFMKKLLITMYSMIKKGEVFNPGYNEMKEAA